MNALKQINTLITDLSHAEIDVLIDILLNQQRNIMRDQKDAIRKELESSQNYLAS